MNDPHVVALIYRVRHGQHVDYSNAGACKIEYDPFTVDVDGDVARVTMKTHFADRADALGAVEPALRAWELIRLCDMAPKLSNLSMNAPRSSIEPQHLGIFR